MAEFDFTFFGNYFQPFAEFEFYLSNGLYMYVLVVADSI